MRKTCQQCHVIFRAQSSQVGHFCSRDCHGLYRRSKKTHDIDGSKRCSVCKQVKPANEFHLVKDNRLKQKDPYLQGRCRSCSSVYIKAWHLRHPKYRKSDSRQRNLKRFGITADAYDHILQNQNYGCAVCGEKTTDSTGRLLSIDHNHDTGEVRGLLCHSCNVALGLFKEDVDLLAKAIFYLTKFCSVA